MTDPRRDIPSVSALLDSDALRPLLARAPRSVVVNAVRQAVDAARGGATPLPAGDDAWAAAISAHLEQATRPSLRPVLNGTGVVLHTNLGRAPLAATAIDAIARVASGYSNLELDLETGARGSRYVHCAALLRELTGAEDALVVNNGAAALVLALNSLATGRGALVSRGELIEIGGSFRIPEIMEKSGARLVEVGTTNRTHLEDYRRAIGADTGAIVKVHPSNFAIEGFVAAATMRELATLATPRGIPLISDLGSGLILPLDEYGLIGEPTARDVLDAGADVVTISGDKLLGGPQAGIILGSRVIVARLRENPLTRSYRVDKLTLAALEATLSLYREPARAVREIPTLAMITSTVAALRERALKLAAAVDRPQRVAIVDSEATVGGGAFPTARIPSIAIAISGDVRATETRLRAGELPVVGRIAADRVLIDVRTVLPEDDSRLAVAITAALR
jgi:L-seryl-tRNA(Ser) seleniumtransferase